MTIIDSEKHLVDESNRKHSFKQSPNVGGKLTPKYLVIHYTAGHLASQAVNWFAYSQSSVSAHLVIDRNGDITQMVPFDQIAYHAGNSYWDGFSGLNQHSIGIELVNAGKLIKKGDKWVTWYDHTIPSREVTLATHKFASTETGWQVYPTEQIDSAIEIASQLVNTYGLIDVLGHDDISPRRKWDPGPAFPMDSFRSKVMGRMADITPNYETTARLKLLPSPNRRAQLEAIETLPKGTKFEILERHLDWVSIITTEDNRRRFIGRMGWIPHRFINYRFE